VAINKLQFDIAKYNFTAKYLAFNQRTTITQVYNKQTIVIQHNAMS